MTQPSPDARAVVRICEQLTTQVRRIADALTTPVAEDVRTADDDATTTCPTPLTHNWGCSCPTDQAPAGGPCAQHPHAPTFNGLCGGCTQYPADMRQTPAADDEQLLRWARRESLLVLVTRVQHGRTLTDDEARTLRQHVETEMHEAETARERAARADEGARKALEQRQAMAEERYAWQERGDRAEAAIERVRRRLRALKNQGATGMTYHVALTAALNDSRGPGPLCHATDPDTLRECALPVAHDGNHEDGDHAWPARATALDGTEQPTTEQQGSGGT